MDFLDPRLSKLKSDYESGFITTDGYIVNAIEILELTEINNKWLSELLGIPYRTLINALSRLREKGLVTIPSVRKTIK